MDQNWFITLFQNISQYEYLDIFLHSVPKVVKLLCSFLNQSRHVRFFIKRVGRFLRRNRKTVPSITVKCNHLNIQHITIIDRRAPHKIHR